MQDLTFRFKRAHLRAVEAHKPLARKFDLTPARFDAMYVLRCYGGTCRQSAIWETLGLSPSTICRMLRSMEKIGLIWREPDETDRRERLVHLTKAGFERIIAAIKLFLRGDALRNFYEVIGRGRALVEQLRDATKSIAFRLYDSSTLEYRDKAATPDENAKLEEVDETVRTHVDDLETRRYEEGLFFEYDDASSTDLSRH